MTRKHFNDNWFNEPGAYVLVDGQFGSTGKGLFAGWLAESMLGRVNKITTNAGPNSGHTAYFDYKWIPNTAVPEGQFTESKIVTQQLPVASVFLDKMGHKHDTIINAGAIVDYSILLDELGKWMNMSGTRVLVHPLAALITNEDRKRDQEVVKKIAGTGKGVGPALMMKMARTGGDDVTTRKLFAGGLPRGYNSWDDLWDWNKDVVFVETAQGFSLGLNTERFYPNVTSRECTVQQALADARIPAQVLKKVVATFRTYPIRVGSTEGSSGNCYPDQKETSWEEIGQTPEITTVTKRVRRVFTWSDIQFRECIATNRPDVLFLNFMNYLKISEQTDLIHRMVTIYQTVMGCKPEAFMLGFGPRNEDIKSVNEYFAELGSNEHLYAPHPQPCKCGGPNCCPF